jgi:hypothetical protein
MSYWGHCHRLALAERQVGKLEGQSALTFDIIPLPARQAIPPRLRAREFWGRRFCRQI